MIEPMNGYLAFTRQKDSDSKSLPSGVLYVDSQRNMENPLVRGKDANGDVFFYFASDAYQANSQGNQYDLIHETNIIAKEVR